MKKIMLLLAAVCMLGVLCASADTKGEDTLFTEAMMKNSLVSVGNTERIQRAIAKAQSGENVVIAYLGGSITEGASAQPQATRCYAYLSAKQFADRFMPDSKQLMYVNAGISGTPSLLGITRAEQDVLSKNPDIVFVEFAVNDSNQMPYRIVYESLIRKLLNSETQPAVILIFTFLDSGYSCQPHMQQIGKQYDLAMISVKDAIQPQINLGNMKWSDYSNDYAHPNTEAHAFIADMIGYYYDQAAATPAEPWTMPEDTVYGKKWETLQNVRQDSACIVSTGSFSWGPDRCYSYTNGWKHLAAKGGTEPMVLEMECRGIAIAFKQEKTSTRGACEVWVDGRKMKTLPGQADNAWGNIITEMIDIGSESEMHTIEFRMAEGDENKNFTLLDIGYVP